jgi:hypothetical protein
MASTSRAMRAGSATVGVTAYTSACRVNDSCTMALCAESGIRPP